MPVSYEEHRQFLMRERDGFIAELEGFLAASYAPTVPPVWYAGDEFLRKRFKLGFEDGKAKMVDFVPPPTAVLCLTHRHADVILNGRPSLTRMTCNACTW